MTKADTTTVAVSMMRDEADVAETVVRNMLAQVDAVIVADNLSTDETPTILARLSAEFPGRLLLVDDPDPGYRQSEKMTALALKARLLLGADWIVPFDADECWYSPFGDRIADVLADVLAQWLVVPAEVYDHVATGADPVDEPDPVRRLGWRRTKPLALPKVACRWRDDLRIQQGNHGADYLGRATVFDPLLVVRHFPYRSARQLVRKVRNGAAAYAAAPELSADLGAHWRQWGALLEAHGEPAIEELFRSWYGRETPEEPLEVSGETLAPLIFDPAPIWREDAPT